MKKISIFLLIFLFALSFTAVAHAVEGFLVQGTVYNDVNGNGVMDSAEVGLAGVVVDLTDDDDNLLDSTVTASDGYYAFPITTGGVYKVFETDPDGAASTTPNEVSFEVSDEDVTINFGDLVLTSTYLVFGTVFEDMNGNGIMEAGEAGVAGVTVSLSDVGDNVTDAAGTYAFAITETHLYSVDITVPEGYMLTTPNPMNIIVTDADVQVNFGLRIYVDLPVDVKPWSNVNPVNLRSKGATPVVILGSDSMDVAMIDPVTLRLNGVSPLRWSYEDVGGDGVLPDGYEDMTLKFSTREIAASLGDVQRGDVVTLTLTGEFFDGTIITGEEMVWIVQVPK
jgi:hypothetical protein